MGVYINMEMPIDGNETIIRIQPLDQYGHHLAITAVPVPPHGPIIVMDDFLSEWSELESYRTAMRLCEVLPAEEGET